MQSQVLGQFWPAAWSKVSFPGDKSAEKVSSSEVIGELKNLGGKVVSQGKAEQQVRLSSSLTGAGVGTLTSRESHSPSSQTIPKAP